VLKNCPRLSVEENSRTAYYLVALDMAFMDFRPTTSWKAGYTLENVLGGLLYEYEFIPV